MKLSKYGFHEAIASAVARYQRSKLEKGCFPWNIEADALRSGIGMTSLPVLMRRMRSEGYFTSERVTVNGASLSRFYLTKAGAALARKSPAVEVKLPRK